VGFVERRLVGLFADLTEAPILLPEQHRVGRFAHFDEGQGECVGARPVSVKKCFTASSDHP
jgi:hypothetical protein